MGVKYTLSCCAVDSIRPGQNMVQWLFVVNTTQISGPSERLSPFQGAPRAMELVGWLVT